MENSLCLFLHVCGLWLTIIQLSQLILCFTLCPVICYVYISMNSNLTSLAPQEHLFQRCKRNDFFYIRLYFDSCRCQLSSSGWYCWISIIFSPCIIHKEFLWGAYLHGNGVWIMKANFPGDIAPQINLSDPLFFFFSTETDRGLEVGVEVRESDAHTHTHTQSDTHTHALTHPLRCFPGSRHCFHLGSTRQQRYGWSSPDGTVLFLSESKRRITRCYRSAMRSLRGRGTATRRATLG